MRTDDLRGITQNARAEEHAELVCKALFADRDRQHAKPAQVVLAVLDALYRALARKLQRGREGHLDLDRLRDVVDEQRQVRVRLFHGAEVGQHLVHAVRVVVGRCERQRIRARVPGVLCMPQRQRGRAVADVGDYGHPSAHLLDGRFDASRPFGFGQRSELSRGAH